MPGRPNRLRRRPRRSPGPATIETVRCSGCRACVGINDRMFAINAKGQAIIVDPAAGSYRELVEAAELCQVAVIHPGRPRDPGEPGLEELLRRAARFL